MVLHMFPAALLAVFSRVSSNNKSNNITVFARHAYCASLEKSTVFKIPFDFSEVANQPGLLKQHFRKKFQAKTFILS